MSHERAREDVKALFEVSFKYGNTEMVEELLEELGISYGKVSFVDPIQEDGYRKIIGIMSEYGIGFIRFSPPKDFYVTLFPMTLNRIVLHRKKGLIADNVSVEVTVNQIGAGLHGIPYIIVVTPPEVQNFIKKRIWGLRKLVKEITRYRWSYCERAEGLVRELLGKLGIQHEYDSSHEYYIKRIDKDGYITEHLVIDMGYKGELFERIVVYMPRYLKTETPHVRIFFDEIDHELKINVIPVTSSVINLS